jgi:hypothetical protein
MGVLRQSDRHYIDVAALLVKGRYLDYLTDQRYQLEQECDLLYFEGNSSKAAVLETELAALYRRIEIVQRERDTLAAQVEN